MITTVFLVQFADGTERRMSCMLDPDKHTSMYVRGYLEEQALRDRIFEGRARISSIQEWTSHTRYCGSTREGWT
jgi:hypothetical protein